MDITKQTASAAYIAAHYETVCLLDRLTVCLLDRLNDIVGSLPDPVGEKPINWGHVGSLRHVIAMLKEVETHLEGATK